MAATKATVFTNAQRVWSNSSLCAVLGRLSTFSDDVGLYVYAGNRSSRNSCHSMFGGQEMMVKITKCRSGRMEMVSGRCEEVRDVNFWSDTPYVLL